MSDIEEAVERKWARALSRLAVGRPYGILAVVGLVTVAAMVLSGRLEMRMNWADLLPDGNPTVERYREIQRRFGDLGGIVVVLEGDRDAIVGMAEELEPRLAGLEEVRAVMGRAPVEHYRNHGALLLEPNDFDRLLRSHGDYTLVGSLRGLNDDFEREYTDSEANLRRDEVDVARSVVGITRSLELVSAGLAGRVGPEAMAEAADAWVLGEPWLLSLDRHMLILSCMPEATWLDLNGQLAALDDVEATLAEVGARHPEVRAATTGMVRIARDEMASVGSYTILLSLAALALIFLLLARTLRGWVVPLLSLVPLVVGIVWSMGLIQLLFGSINLFTSMMALVLLGLGIDFAIHVTTRFQEERSRGGELEDVLTRVLSTTGVAVAVGAFTTAIAFYTLVVGRTVGFDEFGVAAAAGVLLTLLAVLVALPSLLVLRERRRPAAPGESARLAASTRAGFDWIGRLAGAAWNRPIVTLGATLVVTGLSVFGMLHTRWEWDFLELEAEGLRSVELQREIPRRFGMSDQAAWVVAGSLEESRALKDALEDVPPVGDVSALSDLVPPTERVARYRPRLEAFRAGPLTDDREPWPQGARAELAREVARLWDNLDLMSNLAFTAGLDRIVTVIDRITGLDEATGQTDPDGLLPTLSRQLAAGDGPRAAAGEAPNRAGALAAAWAIRMRADLRAITNPAAVSLADVPADQQRLYLPREGDGQLVYVSPRRYLGDHDALERFAAQTEEVAPGVVSTEKLILVMNRETLRDGESAVLMALVVIAGLLLLYFRSPVGLLATLPLGVGAVTMLGLMHLLGMKYNYINMIAVPIILGIGIDDGVHALHRFLEAGRRSRNAVVDAFRHVGKAIFLTSATTMIGFGSVALYEMRGMASFGQVLFLGVGTCFVATVVVLPAALRVLPGRVLERAAHRTDPGRTDANRAGADGSGRRAVTASLLLLLAGLAAGPASGEAQVADTRNPATRDAADADTTDQDGATWLARIESAETVPHSYSVVSQTITTSSGAERTFRMRSWSAEDGDVGLMAYVEPRRVAGDRILQLEGGDQFWYYMKRRDVTRHFAGHTRRQKAMGSDFSYEDLAMGDFTEDYTAELLGREELDGEAVVRLRLTPTPSGPSYDHLIVWAGEDDHLTRRIEYYDDGHHLKTLTVGDFTVIEGRRIARRLEMVNHREGSRTVLQTEAITFARPPNPSLFTRAGLTRPLPAGGRR